MIVPQHFYACDACRAKPIPMDACAGLSSRMFSEHTWRVVTLAGSTWPFDEASSSLSSAAMND
jgi:hypothetical protein